MGFREIPPSCSLVHWRPSSQRRIETPLRSLGHGRFGQRCRKYEHHASKSKTLLNATLTNAMNTTRSNLIHRTAQFQDPKTRFWENLGELWEQGRYTDVTLVVGGQEIKAHKTILAANSDVFRAMFENNMKEKQVLNPGLGKWSFVRTMCLLAIDGRRDRVFSEYSRRFF